ncbi:PHD finger family protein, partial [Perilla frutescens var. frutescens]
MAAIAIMDLLRKHPNSGGQTFNSRGLFPGKLVGSSTASSAAAPYAFGLPFAFGAFLGNGATQYAYCDAGATLGEDYLSSIRTASGKIFQNDALTYSTKQYNVQLKPLFSAFHWKTLALTSLRSFSLFYLPLLEPHLRPEEDDDFLREDIEDNHIDLAVPFKKSVRQIAHETTVATTRRLLERLAVYHVSQRMAWKLLKDVPKSALRKAARGMPTFTYIYRVSRTTFRGHFLGVLASWTVHVCIDIYRFFSSVSKARQGIDTVDTRKHVRILGRKVYSVTMGCSASLVFASIGAGIGATLTRPSAGQWIGSGIGDLAGPIIVAFCFEKLRSEKGKEDFLQGVARVEQFLKDPWLIKARENATIQVLVPKVTVSPLPPPPPPQFAPDVSAPGVGGGAEEASAQVKRAALQKQAAAASLVAEDYARRFESGDLEVSARDGAGEEQGLSTAKVMCRLCFSGENDGSERARKMLSCNSCGKKYHRSCLKAWSQNRDLFHWSSWTCPSCRTCEVCRRTGDPNKFMFCKRCDGACHCYCQQPPHKNVSHGPYLCPKHTKCHSCDSTVPGNGLSVRWLLGYTCCDACGRLFGKGNYCPVCLK